MSRNTLAGIALALVLAGAGAFAAHAQETPTPSAPKEVVSVGAWDYPIRGDDPVVVYIDQHIITPDGVFVAPIVFLRTESGYVPMTACDDVAIRCAPSIVRATGPLGAAYQGQTYGVVAASE